MQRFPIEPTRPRRAGETRHGSVRKVAGSTRPTVGTAFSSWRAALCEATHRLRAAGIDQPAREARLLLMLAADLPGGRLSLEEVDVPAAFWPLLDRRVAREPMARLRGRQGFWTLDLALSAETLIPRADSETLIEAAIAARPDRSSVGAVLDLGTGSGALLLAALVEFPAAWGVGVDVSPGACRMAAGNAASNGLGARAAFVCADWSACLAGRFDLVLCNPPYIERPDLAFLAQEVAMHEPRRALDGGEDGLAAYRRLIPGLPDLMEAGGVALLEHGEGQGEAIARQVGDAGLVVLATPSDLGGVRRAVAAQKPVGGRPVSDYV